MHPAFHFHLFRPLLAKLIQIKTKTPKTESPRIEPEVFSHGKYISAFFDLSLTTTTVMIISTMSIHNRFSRLFLH